MADDLSPAESFLEAAEPGFFSEDEDTEPVYLPWTPKGKDNPQKTIIAADDLEFSPPPPQTAGGGIPSAFAHFRRWGPDES